MMKTFIQYITEKSTQLVSVWPSDSKDTTLIRGQENPTVNELLQFVKSTRGIRFIVTKKGSLLVWKAGDAIHDSIARGEGLGKHEYVTGTMYPSVNSLGKDIDVFIYDEFGAKEKMITKNRTMKLLSKKQQHPNINWEVV